MFLLEKKGKKETTGIPPVSYLKFTSNYTRFNPGNAAPLERTLRPRARAYNVSRLLILLPHGRDTSEGSIIFALANLSPSANYQRGFRNANFHVSRNAVR